MKANLNVSLWKIHVSLENFVSLEISKYFLEILCLFGKLQVSLKKSNFHQLNFMVLY